MSGRLGTAPGGFRPGGPGSIPRTGGSFLGGTSNIGGGIGVGGLPGITGGIPSTIVGTFPGAPAGSPTSGFSGNNPSTKPSDPTPVNPPAAKETPGGTTAPPAGLTDTTPRPETSKPIEDVGESASESTSASAPAGKPDIPKLPSHSDFPAREEDTTGAGTGAEPSPPAKEKPTESPPPRPPTFASAPKPSAPASDSDSSSSTGKGVFLGMSLLLFALLIVAGVSFFVMRPQRASGASPKRRARKRKKA
jgi:hypothetical protein